MQIQRTSATLALPTTAPDPVLQAGLAELFQLGLGVARVSARLADVEGRAIEALADTVADATRNAIAKPESLADAIDAGHKAEASEAARETIAARIASLTVSFDQAARAVRRTAALQARLAEGHSTRVQELGRDRQPASVGNAKPPANDAERAERSDDPEWGDEIGGRSNEEVVHDICRDLAPASPTSDPTLDETPLTPHLSAAIRALATHHAKPGARPRIVRAVTEDPPGALPEPDI